MVTGHRGVFRAAVVRACLLKSSDKYPKNYKFLLKSNGRHLSTTLNTPVASHVTVTSLVKRVRNGGHGHGWNAVSSVRISHNRSRQTQWRIPEQRRKEADEGSFSIVRLRSMGYRETSTPEFGVRDTNANCPQILSNFISSPSDRKRRRKSKIKQLYNTTQRNKKHRQTFVHSLNYVA